MPKRLLVLFAIFLSSCASPPLVEMDTRPPVVTAPIPVRRVVLVHGIWQNEWVSFGRIRHTLEDMGVECLAPSLKPSDGGSGLADCGRQLKEAIDQRFGPDEHFTILAFSMGGLVSREYLQELGGAKRCDGLFTVSTPHHGTAIAWLYFGKGARDMRPGSAFLKNLEATQDRLGKLPIVSYRTRADIVVVPSSNSIWDRAENVAISCPLHQMMTASPAVKKDILSRIKTPAQR